MTVVETGIHEGDFIVTDGQLNLFNGAKVFDPTVETTEEKIGL